MPRKTTQEEFIALAKQVHSGRYDYSQLHYVNTNADVVIVCPVHGPFKQKAKIHLKGGQCQTCRYTKQTALRTKTTAGFIVDAQQVHGDRFDYGRAVYKGSHQNITIECGVHGPFEQLPTNHLKGMGCPECGRKQAADVRRYDTEWFITEARKTHAGRYDYVFADYTGVDSKIAVVCPTHGTFQQTAYNHLRGDGCIKCRDEMLGDQRRKGTDRFVQEARLIHGDIYDYSQVVYKSGKTKVLIACQVHGVFRQAPLNHISGNGCPRCNRESRGEQLIAKWLDSQEIKYLREYKFDRLPYKRFDFYLPQYNAVIEFHGVQHFSPVEFFGGEKDFRRHIESDQTKAEFLAQSKTPMLVLTYEDYAASRVSTILAEWFAQRGVEHELYKPKTYKVD